MRNDVGGRLASERQGIVYNSAVVSGKPCIRLKFWTAAPEAPLIEVVDRADHDDAAADAADRDVAEVRAADVLRRRQRLRDAHERLVGVELLEHAEAASSR